MEAAAPPVKRTIPIIPKINAMDKLVFKKAPLKRNKFFYLLKAM